MILGVGPKGRAKDFARATIKAVFLSEAKNLASTAGTDGGGGRILRFAQDDGLVEGRRSIIIVHSMWKTGSFF